MAQPLLYTYYDALAAATDFLGGNATSAAQGEIKRAIQAAYREINDIHDWKFLYKQGRVHLVAPYTTGTCTYDHSGGSTCENQLTLTTGTWPSWAASGVVQIGTENYFCHVAARKSDTVLQLDPTLNPGEDVSTASTYSIFKQWYDLPWDFSELSEVWTEDSYKNAPILGWNDFEAVTKYNTETGTPDYYCVRPVQDLYGTMGLWIYPRADAAGVIDFIYKRKPRQLRYSGWDANDTVGTITVVAGNAGVTGSSTVFASRHVGSVLRVGSDSTHIPTGLDGNYPFDDERIISAYTGATAVTLDTTITTSRSGVKYCLTDPIDLHPIVYTAFQRCVEKHLAIAKNMQNKAEVFAAYQDALFIAKNADCYTTPRQVAAHRPSPTTRLADYSVTDNM